MERALRLLVVEDHGDLRRALKSLFELLGHEAHFVENVALALQAAREESFDVLLSDIGLPDGTGWDLLRQLEQSGHQPPFAIAMSGFGLGEDLERSKAAGFAVHLVKPFPPGDLARTLDAVRQDFPASTISTIADGKGSSATKRERLKTGRKRTVNPIAKNSAARRK